MPLVDVGAASQSSNAHDSGSDSGGSRSSSPLSQVQSSSASSNDSSSSSSSNDGAEDPSRLKLAEYLELEARRARTSKARAAAIAGKAARRLAKHAILDFPEHPAQDFRDDVKGTNTLMGPGAHRPRRLRLLVSYLKAWGCQLANFVQSRAVGANRVSHCLTTSIVDDCNMRLSAPPPGVHQWVVSRVTAVMNNCQTLIFGGLDGDYRAFPVYTPLVCLPRSDCRTLCQEFIGRLLAFLGEVPKRFHQFFIPSNLTENIPIQALAMCSDALATNAAVVKEIRTAVHAKHQANGSSKVVFPFLAVFCAIHQLALARKSIVYGFSNFWSSITRLSHLFEVHTFRCQFRAALVQEICESFLYVAVSQLPPEAKEWEHHRKECIGLMSTSSFRKKRVELHRELMDFDNGNIEDPKFVHYCIGSCCEGMSHEQKSQHALLQICRYYAVLFTYGCSVPLLYRWKHAHEAMKFVRATSHLDSEPVCLSFLKF